jgi:hypothetical protein
MTTEETSLCPFCGHDGMVWDEGYCEHLIGDYGDGSDGDEQILCGAEGSRCGNAALECLVPLRDALVEFARRIASPEYIEEEGFDAEDATELERALFGATASPIWFTAITEAMSGFYEPNHWAVSTIWNRVVPWSDTLIETGQSTDHMASTYVSFVWAKEPTAGARAIQGAIAPVTAEVRSTLPRLDELRWKMRVVGVSGEPPGR